MLWIHRGLEALWLLTIILVPLAFLGRNFGEWSSIIGSFELPKIAILRTLVGLMASLWLIEWAITGLSAIGPSGSDPLSVFRSSILRPGIWFRSLVSWLRAQPTRWFVLAVSLFVGSTLLSTVLSASFSVSMWGDVPGQDSYGTYTVVCYVLLFAVIATHLRSPAQMWRLIGAIIFVGLLVSGYAIFQHYEQDFLDLMEPPGKVRATSTLGGPIFAAALLLMTISVSLAAATVTTRESPKSRRAWLKLGLWSVVLTLQLLGIIFTLSRGPWLGTGASLVGFIGLTGVFVGWRVMVRPVLVLAVAGALVWAILSLTPQLEDQEQTRVAAPSTTSSAEAVVTRVAISGAQVTGGGLSGRREIWESSWQLMTDRPWFMFDDLGLSFGRQIVGYGPDLFRNAYLLESPPGSFGFFPQEVAHAHNYFIHLGVEVGFLGLLTYAGIFLALFVVGGYLLIWRRRSLNQVHKLLLAGLLATLAGRLLEQMVGIGRVSDLTLFWVLLAAFVALPTAMQTQELSGEEPAVPGDRPLRTRRSNSIPGVQNRWLPLARASLVAVVVLSIGTLTWFKTINYARAAVVADAGAIQFREGQLNKALTSIDRAIDLAPDVSTYYGQRAVIYEAFRDAGPERLEQICGLETSAQSHQSCLAQKLLSNGSDWVDQRPFSYRSRLALGASSLELGLLNNDKAMLDEAVQAYVALGGMVPSSWTTWKRIGAVYLSVGEPESALEPLRKALTITGGSENSFDALRIQGTAYQLLGRHEEAIQSLEESLRISPGNPLAYFELGTTFYESDQPQNALVAYANAIRFQPVYAEAHFSRGTIYYELNRFARAIEELSIAIRSEIPLAKSELAFAHNNRGLAYSGLGDMDLAIKDFDQAIRLEPGLAIAYNNRGFVSRDLGQLDRALEDLDQAIGLDPELTIAYYNRALALTLLGQDLAAESDKDRATELGFDLATVSEAIEELKKRR